MRAVSRLFVALLWGVQLSMWMAVPLLDVGIYEPGAMVHAPGERPGSYRDHDHRICLQFFANQAAPTDAPVLPLPLYYGRLLEQPASFSLPSLHSPPPSARDPPRI